MSQHSLYVEIKNQDGALYEKSDRINPINRINFEIQRKYFNPNKKIEYQKH